jgi:hypothetical protein
MGDPLERPPDGAFKPDTFRTLKELASSVKKEQLIMPEELDNRRELLICLRAPLLRNALCVADDGKEWV